MYISLKHDEKVKFTLENRIVLNDDLDDVGRIFQHVCEEFSDLAEFEISGFGQSPWPVDVRTDLPCLLEQIPDVLMGMSMEGRFDIDFYEQGIERTLHGTIKDNYVNLSCSSMTEWMPNPIEENLEVGVLKTMLEQLVFEFIKIVKKVDLEMDDHPWFVEWKSSCVV